MRTFAALITATIAAGTPVLAFAQDGAANTSDSGDTAWILICAALMLLLVMPGLALFYAGRVRAQHVLSVMLQCAAIMAIVSLLWIVVGYTLAFGEVAKGPFGGWIGEGNAWMLNNLGDVRQTTDVPESAFALFQMMFAVLAPALMTGAWAGRAQFGWVIGFCMLWSVLVYAPIAHWVWGGGWLGSRLGTLDYAGGIVVLISASVSALVVSLLLGKRKNAGKVAAVAHSPAMALAGAALLWIGWLALTGGASLAAGDDAASAMINTHLAACTSGLLWLLIEKNSSGKPTAISFATGAVAGLAAITPAAGLISPGAAMILGATAAEVSYASNRWLRNRKSIDDTLGVFAIFGASAMTGTLLLAVLLVPALGGVGYAAGQSMAGQFTAQVIGIAVVAAWSAIASVILALAVSLFLPMRAPEEAERDGLDAASHGEGAWQAG